MGEEREEGPRGEGDERIEQEGERAGTGGGVEGGERSAVVGEGGVQLFGDVGGSGRVKALIPFSKSCEPGRKSRDSRVKEEREPCRPGKELYYGGGDTRQTESLAPEKEVEETAP